MPEISIDRLSPEVIANLTKVISALWTPVMMITYFIGLLLFGFGLYALIKGERLGGGLATIILSAFLLAIPSIMNLVSYSVFAVSAPDALTYTASGVENAGLITLGIRTVQLLGLIVLTRSILYFKDYANEQQSQLLYRGTAFFAGAIVCLNIVQVLNYFGSWIGGDINSLMKYIL